MMRAAGLIALTATLAGCAPTAQSPRTEPQPPPAGTPWIVTGAPAVAVSSSSPSAPAPDAVETYAGTFRPKTLPTITYDTSVVPSGATAKVELAAVRPGLMIGLTVTGMVPRRSYGAHLHTQPCTLEPDDAGPHYQHQADPSKPSVDPSYANPRNEVWLDFTADERGGGHSMARQEWVFDPARPPRSLVVHEKSTRTDAGKAGTAGARVACLTLDA
ncbi:superoxide dismutase [Symbioplanes lichenis]|uniref:superoxide dismutase n=1 Tax=Symbioplanes lichenis TaxID=1629072 RepID=UPI0027389B09|nr:superoxide dismutase [Actinoplanes lichenis]